MSGMSAIDAVFAGENAVDAIYVGEDLVWEAGGGAFNPLTQVTALHAMWAEDPLWTPPADGGAVDAWRNQSGGGDPAAALTVRPLYRAATVALNSKPTIEFDGVNDSLAVNIADIAHPFKMLVVGKRGNTDVSENIVGLGASAGSGLGVSSANRWFVACTTAITETGVTDTNPHIWRATINGASSQFWEDGVSQASGNAGSASAAELILGAGGTIAIPARWMACHLAFVGIYAGATDDADLTALAASLATHYGL